MSLPTIDWLPDEVMGVTRLLGREVIWPKMQSSKLEKSPTERFLLRFSSRRMKEFI